MRTLVTIMFNVSDRPWAFTRDILLASGLNDLAQAGPAPLGFYAVELDEESLSAAALRSRLASEGIEWMQRRDKVYTVAEIESAPLLWLTVTTSPRGQGGPTHGTTFDLDQGCPYCGTGATQTSRLVMKRSDLPRKGDVFSTLDGEILISCGLARSLRDSGLSGFELRSVVSSKDGTELSWVQFLPTQVMPRMSPNSRGLVIENPCSVCERDGFFHSAREPVEIMYPLEAFDEALPDVVSTWECFGNSRLTTPFGESHFAMPLVLVKPSVYRLCRALKVKGLEFTPVTVDTSSFES